MTTPPKTTFIKRVTLADAPQFLNLNDQAMWVLGWNEGYEAATKTLTQKEAK